MSASTPRGGYSQKPNGLGLQESVAPFVIPSSFDIRASSFYMTSEVRLLGDGRDNVIVSSSLRYLQ